MNVYVVRRLMNNKLGRLSTYSSVPVCGRYDNYIGECRVGFRTVTFSTRGFS
jgi:hypothetical protein